MFASSISFTPCSYFPSVQCGRKGLTWHSVRPCGQKRMRLTRTFLANRDVAIRVFSFAGSIEGRQPGRKFGQRTIQMLLAITCFMALMRVSSRL